ncbi:hypothetical protein SY86_19670 [Erwinia tracheiphila]|uniref:Uncharacterized protein n=1 Tax=Erwinia tracheiphila TaxID=65700 RepID=A0A0M2KCM6_9GAMM|nr:hypothetical protein SY86_19670 [Erwinia tracheiphila]
MSFSCLQTGKRGGVAPALQYRPGDHNRRRVHGFEHLHPVPFTLRELIGGNGEQDGIDAFTGHHGEGSEQNM